METQLGQPVFLSINYTYISMKVLNARCLLNVYFKTRMTITKFIILIQMKIRISCSMSIEWRFPVIAIALLNKHRRYILL